MMEWLHETNPPWEVAWIDDIQAILKISPEALKLVGDDGALQAAMSGWKRWQVEGLSINALGSGWKSSLMLPWKRHTFVVTVARGEYEHKTCPIILLDTKARAKQLGCRFSGKDS